MLCLGFKPDGATGWQVQTDLLSCGGYPTDACSYKEHYLVKSLKG